MNNFSLLAQDQLAESNPILNIVVFVAFIVITMVIVTRVSKDSVGEKMRSAMGLWGRKELYIDNDLNQVFARLKRYYGS